MESITMYVVTMYRGGDHEKHSYPVGVYTTYEAAKIAGRQEESWRGGKYKADIVPFLLDGMPETPEVQE